MATLDFFSLPDDTIIMPDGKKFGIDMRLKNVMRFIYMASESMPDKVRIDIGLELLLGNKLAEYNYQERISVFLKLIQYIGGETKKPKVYDLMGNDITHLSTEKETEIYTDFKQDFDYIWSDFVRFYNIDLLKERDIDYRKFKVLLNTLPSDAYLHFVVDVRKKSPKDFKGKDRKAFEELQARFELEERR